MTNTINIDAEPFLLGAVRDAIRVGLTIQPVDITVEIDDQAPAVAATEHWTIIPLSVTPGRRNTMSGCYDMIYGVRVVLLVRVGNVPRDRRREVFMSQIKGINRKLGEACNFIHFKYEPINAANAALRDEFPPEECGEFKVPLKWNSYGRPETFLVDTYDAKSHGVGDPIVGIKRGINFTGARYLSVVTQPPPVLVP